MNKTLNNIVIVNVLSVLSKVFLFLLALLITNKLGTKSFGEYSTANTFLIMVMIFMSFGSNFLINREVAKDKDTGLWYLAHISLIKFFVYVLLILLIYFFRSYLPFNHIANKLVIIFTISVFFKSIQEQIFFYYQAIEKFTLYSLMNFLNNFFLYIGSFIILELSAKTDILLIGYFHLVLQVFFLILNQYLVRKFYIKQNVCSIKITISSLKDVIKRSLPFFISSVIGILFNRIDILMLAIMLNEKVVGYYNISYTLYEALLIIPISVASVIFPKIIKSTNDIQETKSLINSVIYHLVHLSIVICIGISIFAEKIIYWLFSSEQDAAVLCLQILVWGLLIQCYSNVLGRVIYANNKEVFFMKIGTLSLAFNIILNLILIPKFSLYGSSIATILSFILSFILQYYFVKRYILGKNFSLFFDKRLLILIVLFTTICFLMLYLNIHIILSILVLALVYILLIFGLRILDINLFSSLLIKQKKV
ncbi:flippase [Neobacillus citreus]|uniref:Flippase n=1 Tax=Neobacillus citreus TaxID=2833578 RepID=A0A942T8E6_9BACI